MADTPLGEILHENGMVSKLQLAEALQIQKEERGRIGDMLVTLGYVTKRQLRYVIKEYKKRIPLGEYLLEKGIISPEDLEIALGRVASTQKPIGQALISRGLISEEELAKFLSEQLDMPFLVPYQRLVDMRLFSQLTSGYMRHNKILPLSREDGITTVVVTGLLDEATNLQLENVFGDNIELAIGPASRIEETIDALLDGKQIPIIEEFEDLRDAEISGDIGRTDMGIDQFEVLGSETRAVELVNYIVSEAIRDGASDIHLEPMADRLQVRFRVNGLMAHKADLPLGIRNIVFGRIKALSDMNVADSNHAQEGRLIGNIEKLKVDLRVSSFIGIYGETISMRLLHQDAEFSDLNDLGFTTNAYSMCRRALDEASGLILFVGPPGSGKTTSLFAVLRHMVEQKLKVITLEDPVEYLLPGAVQGQIPRKKDVDFSSVINSAIHQDPDVIAVGEIPHDERAREVISAALTGHKLLTTFHASDSISALLRLSDLGVETFLKSSTSFTIVSQRLVRKICTNCKTSIVPDPYDIGMFSIKDFDPERYDFFHGRGCSHCHNSGFLGRTGIFEVLTVTEEIRDAFLAGASSQELLAKIRSSTPYLNLSEVGMLKAIRQVTTVDEILRVAPTSSQDSDGRNTKTMEEIERVSESTVFGA
jgi:type IV pilus assembly protein PilB